MGRWEANANELQQQICTALVYIRSVLCEVRGNNRVKQWTQPLLKCLKNLQTSDSKRFCVILGSFQFSFQTKFPWGFLRSTTELDAQTWRIMCPIFIKFWERRLFKLNLKKFTAVTVKYDDSLKCDTRI